MRTSGLILGLVCALILCGVLSPGIVSASSQIREKARYYYLLGVEREATGDDDSAYEFYKHALAVDPTYDEARYSTHTMKMRLQGDSVSMDGRLESLAEIRKFVDANPGDYYESRYYIYLATNLMQPLGAIEVCNRLYSIYPDKTDVLLELAEAYMMTDSLQGALRALSRYEDIEGKSSEISLRKISYMLSYNDSTGALSEAKSLVSSNPRNPGYKVLEGHVYEYTGNKDSALFSYKSALDLDPSNPNTMLALANHYMSTGDSVRYDDMVYNVLLSEEMGLPAKLSLISEYLARQISDKSPSARGDYLFSTLRDQYPHEPEVLDLAARYSAAKEKWNEAQEEISYAIDLRPENAEYWGQLMAYQIAGDVPAKAVETYARAMEKGISPSRGMKYFLTSAYSMSGDYDKAISHSADMIHEVIPSLLVTDSITDKRMLDRYSREDLAFVSDLLCGIGDAYTQKNDTLSAFDVYRNSLILNPDNALALNNYAYYLSLKGEKLDRAAEMSRKSLQLSPDNPTFLDTYAWILFKKKEYAEARKYQLSAIEKTPAGEESGELFEHYGDILFMDGDPEEALIYWRKALEITPDSDLLQRKVKYKTFFYE